MKTVDIPLMKWLTTACRFKDNRQATCGFSMSIRHALPCCLIAAMFCINATKAYALGDDTFTISAGGSLSRFDSDVTVNGEIRDNNASIDLENDLGQEEDVNFLSVRALWRFAERHRLSIEYTPFSRESSTVLDRDLEFDDTVIQAGGSVSSDSDFAIYDVNYIYSVYKSETIEVGVSGGIYWIDLDFDIQARGVINDSQGNIEFEDDYRDGVSSDVPLPLFGLYFDYQFAQRWQFRAAGRYFSADIDNYDGSITSLLLGVEYNVWKAVSVGVSATHFELDVGTDQDSFRGDFGWSYSGTQLYLKAQF